jgi:hypothetical protein
MKRLEKQNKKLFFKFYLEFHFLFASDLGRSTLSKNLKVVVTHAQYMIAQTLTSSQLAKAVAACFQDSKPFTFSKNCNEIIIESICHFQLSIPVSCLKYLQIRSTEEKCYGYTEHEFCFFVNNIATSSSLKTEHSLLLRAFCLEKQNNF